MYTLFTYWNGLDINRFTVCLNNCVELYPESGNHSIIALCNELYIPNLLNKYCFRIFSQVRGDYWATVIIRVTLDAEETHEKTHAASFLCYLISDQSVVLLWTFFLEL